MRRNVFLLVASQSLLMTGNVVAVSTAALVGAALAPAASLATLPLALQFLATMLTTIPASLLMGRTGRAPGFVLGALAGVGGAALATAGILQGSFLLFCAATVLFGVFNGFGGYYRFAAAEASTPDYRPRAVSYVMAGGVVAALAGPNLARWARELVGQAEFAGSYAVLLGIFSLAVVLPLFLRIPRPPRVVEGDGGRPLVEIARQPAFVVAVMGAMVGYAVMVLLMTATPLAMRDHAHDFSATATVIQWHVLAMFVPSFITGHLIVRFGVLNVMLAGGALGAGALVAGFSGTGFLSFLFCLLLLGTSWNFLFIGGTTLLTETYRPEERAKTQALNNFLVFSTVTVASLSAAALLIQLRWQAVLLGVVPLLVLILALVLWLKARRRAEGQAPANVQPEAEAIR